MTTKAELEDKYLRALAEVENMRKQHRIELDRARTDAEHRLLGQILGVIDDIERAADSCSASTEAVNQGLALIREKAQHVLKSEGIEAYSTVGKPFDAAIMHAIAACSTKALPPGSVVEQLTCGYTRHGAVLRPAQVVVAKGDDDE